MKIDRKYTQKNSSPYALFSYVKRTSILRNPDGSTVFEMNDIEVPSHWSQLATDILAQKYFRKAGVPQENEDGTLKFDSNGNIITGAETSAKQVVHRLAGAWTDWGKRYKYFDTEEDSSAFYDELVYMLLNQMCAPNSPQWFNTGLHFAYGIAGTSQGHYFVSPETGLTMHSKDAYTRPQTSACFIQAVDDDLVNEGGIFDLLSREARIFKYGSGTGTNFSSLRSATEKLSGGGVSSGLMSFLKVFDRAAGAIKSGGTTRRAAKMVILNIDHPDVEEFIEWKSKEEDKVASLVAGSKVYSIFMQAILDEATKNGASPHTNKNLKTLIQKALNRGVPLTIIKKTLDMLEMGFTNMTFEAFDTKYEGEAYLTVSGQNSNNSIRVTNDFMEAVEKDEMWELKFRKSNSVAKVVKARELFDKINLSAWKSADPGMQYDTTTNEWHTCPQSGRINASNPCSEYMFLDDSACNLASINLVKFWDKDKSIFLVDEYKHTIKIWTLVLEISVLMAQFPSKKIAELSYEYRTLGLGYANLGSLLMIAGIPYDSPESLAMTGAISSLLTSEAYTMSAMLAKEVGAFKHFEKNRSDMLRVVRNHRNVAYNVDANQYENLSIKPQGIDAKYCPDYLLQAAKNSWDNTLELGEQYGFRNAQVSVIAPTGTIALVMDCDTTGIEPDFAIVKYKKLAGGGYFKIVNQSVKIALKKLGYLPKEIEDIEKYSVGNATLENCPAINRQALKTKGFSEDIIEIIEKQLPTVFDIKFAFNKHSIGEDFLTKLGLSQKEIDNPNLDILSLLGFSEKEIEKANNFICGTMMLEGAPHLKTEHLPIFDCANKCGKNGKRFIPYMAHLRIMAAAQPFITGAISKTVNMPANATVDEISNVHITAWKMMLKAITIYRDGSKLSQPLNSSMLSDLDEVVTLGDEISLDETIGPKEIHEMQVHRLVRKKLPKRRKGITREATVGGQKIFLRTGEYDDGSLGEIFLDMYKDGAAFRGMLNSFAILVSKALQYGVPLEELVDTFTFTKFEPQGIVQGHEAVKFASSVLDYVFRSLGYDYLDRTDFVHKKDNDKTTNGSKISNYQSQNTSTVNTEKTISPIDKLLLDAGITEDEPVENTMPLPFTNGASSNFTVARTSSLTTVKALLGYTGEQCTNCSSIRVKRNGSCLLCEDCGTTSGCS
jgi:ribonucleoside-diphosphate reductase alpha chain